MKTEFPCPACESDQWQPVQAFHYERHDHAANGHTRLARRRARLSELWQIFRKNAPAPAEVHFPTLNDYEKLRRRVLFEIWFRDRERITIKSQICQRCGFIAYAPRPTDNDIRDKYLFLNQSTVRGDSRSPISPLVDCLERRRARRVFDLLRPQLSTDSIDVLDYGGADGKMLRPFLQNGDCCWLVDYDDHQIDGVTKIANDLTDMPPGRKFDAVICNHVLEHVAEPLPLVKGLRDCLKSGGAIYAEVPHQILAGVRLGTDPVTHVNFFSPRSFSLLFRRAGFEVSHESVCIGNYGRARLKVICLVAKKPTAAIGDLGGVDQAPSVEIQQLLHPGRLQLLGHLADIHIWPRLENLSLKVRRQTSDAKP